MITGQIVQIYKSESNIAIVGKMGKLSIWKLDESNNF